MTISQGYELVKLKDHKIKAINYRYTPAELILFSHNQKIHQQTLSPQTAATLVIPEKYSNIKVQFIPQTDYLAYYNLPPGQDQLFPLSTNTYFRRRDIPRSCGYYPIFDIQGLDTQTRVYQSAPQYQEKKDLWTKFELNF